MLKTLSRKLDKALFVAEKFHLGQYRRHSGIPYLTHPLSVLRVLTHLGVEDETMLVASILHDTLEDTRCPEILIRAAFGDKVLNLVKELTKPIGVCGDNEKKSYLLQFANEASDEALIIKVVDRIVNIEDFWYYNSSDAIDYALQAKDIFKRVWGVSDRALKSRALKNRLVYLAGLLSLPVDYLVE